MSDANDFLRAPRGNASRSFDEFGRGEDSSRKYSDGGRRSPFRRSDDRPRSTSRFRDDNRRDDDRPRFRDDKPRTNKDREHGENRGYGDKPRFRDDKPRFRDNKSRDDRPRFRDAKPRSDRDREHGEDRGYGDKPRFRDNKPRFRDDRPRDDKFRDDRPRFRDDKPRSDRDREHGENRSYGDKPRFRDDRPVRVPRKEAALGPLRDIDEDILRLIARRSRLLSAMPESGSAARERDLRTHWEERAAAVSRDPKLIRGMFALLQEIDVNEAAVGESYNLCPSDKPVDVNLELPLACRQSRLYAALAAVAGTELTLDNMLLNSAVVEFVKAFNQIGANLHWDEYPSPRLQVSAAKPLFGASLPVLDRIVHAGDDPLNLYLLICMLAVRQCRVKIVGESNLRFMNLGSLRHFMPVLGCRLSGLVPGQDGLPVRLESAAMLPDNVYVPADLPSDAATALLLSAPFWEKVATFDLSALPAAGVVLDEIADCFTQCGVAFVRDKNVMTVMPSAVVVSQKPDIRLAPPLAYTLLALPALVGGTVFLTGGWPLTAPGNAAMKDFLSGVTALAPTDHACESRARDVLPETWDLSAIDPKHIGVALAVFVNAVVKGAAKPVMPALPVNADMTVIDDFLAHLGYAQNEGILEEVQPITAPWIAPDAWWGMAYGLGAFTRRNIRLGNPHVVTSLIPQFWTVMNSLPTPTLSRPAAEMPAVEIEPDVPVRRRIRSNEYLTSDELPPAIDMLQNDEY